MNEQRDKTLNPVLAGLVALVAVSITVGLVLGGVALAGSRIVGLGGDSTNAADSTVKESAVIPKPSRTAVEGPQVTLGTESTDVDATTSEETEPTDVETEKPDRAISLQVGQTAVGNFERIDLSGVYPGGEGAILQVQRFEGGQWVDFNATLSVSNETFNTYVQSAQVGVNKFRVVDSGSGKTSNPVTVRVG
ncbi:hypothetical protein [Nocardioides stalactiti]|uniref:hypothetical protein n=1 Tax=Nocardioides stalactiti TaxID=2755356 RepID=UPI0016008A2C|nr:hypothetical protein [Nocardioides stalactiti]